MMLVGGVLFVLATTGRLGAQPAAATGSAVAARDTDQPVTAGWMEVRVAPLEDTFVREDTDAIYGDRNWLEIGSRTPGGRDGLPYQWSFLKFDTGAAAHVSSARLRLYGARSSRGAGPSWAKVLSSSSDWAEHGLRGAHPAYVWNGLTWDHRHRRPLDRVKLANDKTERWYEWDVSEWVVEERAAGRHVVAFAVLSEIEKTGYSEVALFHSREAETNRPELVLVP